MFKLFNFYLRESSTDRIARVLKTKNVCIYYNKMHYFGFCVHTVWKICSEKFAKCNFSIYIIFDFPLPLVWGTSLNTFAHCCFVRITYVFTILKHSRLYVLNSRWKVLGRVSELLILQKCAIFIYFFYTPENYLLIQNVFVKKFYANRGHTFWRWN